MKEDQKLSAREIAALERVKKNGPLCLQADATEAGVDGGGYIYWTARDGRKMPPKTTARILALGLLRPQQDALFQDAQAQTWVAL